MIANFILTGGWEAWMVILWAIGLPIAIVIGLINKARGKTPSRTEQQRERDAFMQNYYRSTGRDKDGNDLT